MRIVSRRLALAASSAAVAALGGLAQPAQGFVVYAHAGGIWVMADDGSGKRELVSPSDTTSGESLRSPSVDARDGTVVFTSHGAIWKWRDGRASDLTGELVTVVGTGVSGLAVAGNAQPEAAGDGTLVWQHTYGLGSLAWTDMETTILRAPLDAAGTPQALARPCDPFWRDASPAPRPGTQGVAYVGCSRAEGSSILDRSFDQLAVLDTDGNHVLAEIEGAEWQEPSWDPEGNRLVVIADRPTGSNSPFAQELWIVDVSAVSRQVLATQSGVLSSPRFMGEDRVVFGFKPAGTGAQDIYSLPAACDACGIGQARRLTADGDSTEPGWSARSPEGRPPADGVGIDRRATLREALARGVGLKATCARCRALARASITRRLARRLHLAARGSGPVRVAGAAVSVVGSREFALPFTAAARRALAGLSQVTLRIAVRLVQPSGAARTFSGTLTLRR